MAGDDGSGVGHDPPREVVLDEGVHLGMLEHHVLERVAYVLYLNSISMSSRVGEGGGCAAPATYCSD